jgi:tetratricopeptide (TPR) repeat protein
VAVLTHLNEVLTRFRTAGDRAAEGVALHNLAVLERRRGHLDDAARLCESALALHRQVGSRHSEGLTLEELAAVHAARGDLAAARRLYRAALGVHERAANLSRQVEARVDWAMVERQAGDAVAAAAILEQAAGLAAALESPSTQARLACESGQVALAQGGDGREHLEQAREQARRGGDLLSLEVRQAIDQLARAVTGVASGGERR